MSVKNELTLMETLPSSATSDDVMSKLEEFQESVGQKLEDLSFLRPIQQNMAALHAEMRAMRAEIEKLVSPSDAPDADSLDAQQYHEPLTTAHANVKFVPEDADVCIPSELECASWSHADINVQVPHQTKAAFGSEVIEVVPSMRQGSEGRQGSKGRTTQISSEDDTQCVDLVQVGGDESMETRGFASDDEDEAGLASQFVTTQWGNSDFRGDNHSSAHLSSVTSESEWQSSKGNWANASLSVDTWNVKPLGVKRGFRERWCPRRFQVHPDSILRNLWEFCSCFVLLFDSIVIPYILAWSPAVEGFLEVGMCASTIFWTTDILVTLNTSYYTEEGVLEVRPRRIFMRYARTTLLLDAFICTSDWIAMSIAMQDGDATSNEATSLLRLGKINRFIRISRALRSVNRAAKLWSKVEQLSHVFVTTTWHVISQVAAIFLFILWLNHILGCIWYAIGRNISNDTGVSWLDAHVNRESEVRMSESNALYQYTTSYHWAISQLTPGSMDVVPMNSVERIVNILYLLFGLLFCSALISRISALMVQLHMANQEQALIIKRLRAFLRQKSVSVSVAGRVEKQVAAQLRMTRPLTLTDIPSIGELSKPLRLSLKYEIYIRHLHRQPIFLCLEGMHGRVLRNVCESLQSLQLVANSELFTTGTNTRMSYILVHGCMSYSNTGAVYYSADAPTEVPSPYAPRPSLAPSDLHSAQTPRTIEESNTWVSSAALWADWTTKGSMEAFAFSEVVCVDGSKILPVISSTHHRLRSLMKHYQRVFRRFLYEVVEDSDDLDEVVDHALVIYFLPVSNKLEISEPFVESIRHRNWLNWGSGEVLKDLQEDLRLDQCALFPSADGSVVRVAVVIDLRIQRPHGEILLQVAEFIGGQFSSRCHLPSTKLRAHEGPMSTAKTVLEKVQEDLQDWGRNISAPQLCGTDVQKAASSTYGLVTQYHRHIYEAQQDLVLDTGCSPRIAFEADQEGLSDSHRRNAICHPTHVSEPKVEDILGMLQSRAPCLAKHIPHYAHVALHGRGDYSVYVWIYPDEWEKLRPILEGK